MVIPIFCTNTVDGQTMLLVYHHQKSLLDPSKERRRRKEGVCQEDTGIKGIPFEVGCFLTPVSLLQVYFVLTSRTSQILNLHWAAFVQRLISA